MPTFTKHFVDVEKWLVNYLGDIAPVYVVTPSQIHSTIIQVTRVGGSSDRFTDRPRVEIAVYVPEGDPAGARMRAWEITEQIRNRIDGAAGVAVDGLVCDSGRIDNPPQMIPDPNSSIRRVVTTVQLSFRRQ